MPCYTIHLCKKIMRRWRLHLFMRIINRWQMRVGNCFPKPWRAMDGDIFSKKGRWNQQYREFIGWEFIGVKWFIGQILNTGGQYSTTKLLRYAHKLYPSKKMPEICSSMPSDKIQPLYTHLHSRRTICNITLCAQTLWFHKYIGLCCEFWRLD